MNQMVESKEMEMPTPTYFYRQCCKESEGIN